MKVVLVVSHGGGVELDDVVVPDLNVVARNPCTDRLVRHHRRCAWRWRLRLPSMQSRISKVLEDGSK